MKLLFCPECTDIIKLNFDKRFCQCGKSSGAYLPDGLKAWVDGEGFVLGFDNTSFVEAFKTARDVKRLPEMKLTNFRAWVFHPDFAPNITFMRDKKSK
jgi:hypothetical protein